MMRFFLVLLAVATMASAQTNEVIKVKVVGDRVSLRAEPGLDGHILDRAMSGDELIFFEKTNEWVAIQAPDTLDFWVAAEYITNGVVLPAKLNVRSGPSTNYEVMAVLNQGDAVAERGEFKSWLKIAPPSGSRVWISEDYIEEIELPKPVEEPEPAPEFEPVVKDEPEEKLPPLILELDQSKPQGELTEIHGVLRRANPGLYKLVLIDGRFEETICLVRGNESQLEKMLNRTLLIKGPQYWAKGVEWPVIQPEKIHLDPILFE
ncbi:MAG TPA: SH3 domain-containing protein [Pontiella sp.]